VTEPLLQQNQTIGIELTTSEPPPSETTP